MGGGRFEVLDGGDDAVAFSAGQDVPAGRDGFHPFRFITQGNTGNLQPVSLFLHAAGVGKEDARGLFKGDDVEIADWVDDPKGGGAFYVQCSRFNVQCSRFNVQGSMFEIRGALEDFFGSGVKREDDGFPLGKF